MPSVVPLSTGGLAVDRWFHHIDILVAFWLIIYTGISVATAYIKSIPLLYVAFLAQGSVETFLQTGMWINNWL